MVARDLLSGDRAAGNGSARIHLARCPGLPMTAPRVPVAGVRLARWKRLRIAGKKASRRRGTGDNVWVSPACGTEIDRRIVVAKLRQPFR